MRLADGSCLQIVVLDQKDSLALWKGNFQGRDRVFLTPAGLVVDGNSLRLTAAAPGDLSVAIYPAPAFLACNGNDLAPKADGVFQRFAPPAPPAVKLKATFDSVQAAGPPREITLGKIEQPVATAPLDPDFENAAVWRIHLPVGLDLHTDPILRLHYVGDVARVTLNGKLLTDDFYNGDVLDVGLRRFAPEILTGDLCVEILPLRKDAPIYLATEARPDFGSQRSVVSLNRIEIIPRYPIQLEAR
jgi:hypothetical protein